MYSPNSDGLRNPGCSSSVPDCSELQSGEKISLSAMEFSKSVRSCAGFNVSFVPISLLSGVISQIKSILSTNISDAECFHEELL